MTPTEVYLIILMGSSIITAAILYYAYGIISYARLPDTDIREESS